MEVSLFLAKLVGIYLLIIAILWIIRFDVFSSVLEEFLESRPLVFFSGVLSLSVGIAMAVGHSVWEFNWRGLITLMGYLAIVKGIVRIGFPEFPKKAVGRILQGSGVYIWAVVALMLGGYLTWVGFTVR